MSTIAKSEVIAVTLQKICMVFLSACSKLTVVAPEGCAVPGAVAALVPEGRLPRSRVSKAVLRL
jgi:hypothetical protein